ncbi:hypothetical protein FF38_00608 [Lucilia cuprina]|uniref:Uncharacterized protein n=1 Tax=Lucilia cuprina TaxID=7375 RepID=A0A0L0C3K5_LUCCU|nr:hypothetical protein FF38_00608 [Lucilia cuprina]
MSPVTLVILDTLLATNVNQEQAGLASQERTIVESVQQNNEYFPISSFGCKLSNMSANKTAPQSSRRGIERVLTGATFVLEATK